MYCWSLAVLQIFCRNTVTIVSWMFQHLPTSRGQKCTPARINRIRANIRKTLLTGTIFQMDDVPEHPDASRKYGGRYRCSLVHMDLLLQKGLPQKLTWVWLVILYIPLKRDQFKGKSSSKLHFVSGYWDMLVFFVGSTMRHQNVTYKAVFPRAFLVITRGFFGITPINGWSFTRISAVTGPYL